MIPKQIKAFLLYNEGELGPALEILNAIPQEFAPARAQAFLAGHTVFQPKTKQEDTISPEHYSACLDMTLRELAIWANELEQAA